MKYSLIIPIAFGFCFLCYIIGKSQGGNDATHEWLDSCIKFKKKVIDAQEYIKLEAARNPTGFYEKYADTLIQIIVKFP